MLSHRRFDIERMASGPERKDYGVVKLDIEAISTRFNIAAF